ncbi:MAG: hypothetical protein WCR01_12790 [Bacteroidota bacterium]
MGPVLQQSPGRLDYLMSAGEKADIQHRLFTGGDHDTWNYD